MRLDIIKKGLAGLCTMASFIISRLFPHITMHREVLKTSDISKVLEHFRCNSNTSIASTFVCSRENETNTIFKNRGGKEHNYYFALHGH